MFYRSYGNIYYYSFFSKLWIGHSPQSKEMKRPIISSIPPCCTTVYGFSPLEKTSHCCLNIAALSPSSRHESSQSASWPLPAVFPRLIPCVIPVCLARWCLSRRRRAFGGRTRLCWSPLPRPRAALSACRGSEPRVLSRHQSTFKKKRGIDLSVSLALCVCVTVTFIILATTINVKSSCLGWFCVTAQTLCCITGLDV